MDKAQLTTLVTYAQQGNQNAFAQIYEATIQHVYYTAFKILHDDQQAQDIAQEVYITVMQKIGTLQEPNAFLGWLRQITANKCGNYIQKKKEVLYAPVGDEENDGLPDVEDDINEQPDEVLDKTSTKEIILSIIDKLTVEQRAAVVMFYFQQMPIREIASATGEAEGTIKSRLNYARKQIKVGIEKEEERSGIKLHSISFIFLFRLFSQDATVNLPASFVPQNILNNILSQGVGQTATSAASGSATATGTAAANTTAAKAGLSLAAKIGLGVAGIVVAVGLGIGAALLIENAVSSHPNEDVSASMPIVSSMPIASTPYSETEGVSSAEEPPPITAAELTGEWWYVGEEKFSWGDQPMQGFEFREDGTATWSIGVADAGSIAEYTGQYFINGSTVTVDWTLTGGYDVNMGGGPDPNGENYNITQVMTIQVVEEGLSLTLVESTATAGEAVHIHAVGDTHTYTPDYNATVIAWLQTQDWYQG